MAVRGAELFLVCQVGAVVCAVPIEHVVETMRPLPIEAVSGAPDFVRGLAIVRGEPVPVIDAGRLLGCQAGEPRRFVTLAIGNRRVSLAVGDVLGIRAASPEMRELPPLLQDANADVIAQIGALDAELLVVLRSAELVPDSWTGERA